LKLHTVFELAAEPPSSVAGVEVVAVPYSKDDDDLVLGPGAAELVAAHDVDLLALLEHHDASGKAGDVVEHVLLPAEPDRPALTVLLVGVGDAGPADLRRAGAALARRTRGRERASTSVPALADDAGLRAFVEGAVLGSYTFSRRSTDPTPPLGTMVLAGLVRPEARERALERALAGARAGWLARSLATTPSNEKNPAWMAERAKELPDLDVTVWDEERLAREGFGGILAVGQASATPPRMVRIDYTPPRAGRRTPHVVLVGKGITFDTGGLSIKPAEAMMNMKRDMTGAGVVLAVLSELRSVECPVKVTGLLACAENAVGGNALRPGDVIRHYSGRTSEVTNTDAEGRLVLADAIAYAVEEIGPAAIVDVATLTGAMKVSLGTRTAGLFSNDDGLADQLLGASAAAGEPLWRMPLVDEYDEQLDSSIADADNAPGGPGAVIAALFLRHFVGDVPWAHLDIASVGDSPTDSYEWTTGPTGFGARALLHWLENRQPLDGVRARRTTRRR
jgi:leucyl aminopeptidase